MKYTIRLLMILYLELSFVGHKTVGQAFSGQEETSSQETRTARLCSEGLSGTLLLEYGIEHPDELLPQMLDTSSSPINLTTPFPYFGKNETSLYVNTHGILSFEESFVDYTPRAFTQVSNAVVAIYWADGDITQSGTISYRMVEATQDLEYVQGLLSSAFDLKDFKPELVFVATYADIPQTGNTNSNLSNTFQAVLLTDGALSFTLLSYEHIEWTASTSYPNIGFNSGNKSFSLPLALTPGVLHIDNGSNVGIEGLYMYRVDQETIMEPTNCSEVCRCWRETNRASSEIYIGISGSGAENQTSGSGSTSSSEITQMIQPVQGNTGAVIAAVVVSVIAAVIIVAPIFIIIILLVRRQRKSSASIVEMKHNPMSEIHVYEKVNIDQLQVAAESSNKTEEIDMKICPAYERVVTTMIDKQEISNAVEGVYETIQ